MEYKRPMANIIGPRHPVDTAYRVVEREEVLASAFEDFVRQIVAAGWHESEVALTLADIADDYVMTLAARLA
ncbi:hypothetical protein [Rhizobium sp. BK251]|uniref:hypothetical protein n=1 Tax=Rhizobium sp. BK251 TaxID=2512125 RepID=UPI00104E4015|nr:hypothetical protein [Rhizobium sp. BK251]TCL64131.1 hypothetical protein EV286_11566 [Rhizobium sp. BK251]